PRAFYPEPNRSPGAKTHPESLPETQTQTAAGCMSNRPPKADLARSPPDPSPDSDTPAACDLSRWSPQTFSASDTAGCPLARRVAPACDSPPTPVASTRHSPADIRRPASQGRSFESRLATPSPRHWARLAWQTDSTRLDSPLLQRRAWLSLCLLPGPARRWPAATVGFLLLLENHQQFF